LEALKRTLYIDRGFVLGHFVLGVLHQRLGHTREALHAWRIAQDLLQQMPPDELLSHGEGLTAGRLLPALAMNLESGAEDET
jgi:chemotaxis protein methyltransferase CheR